MRALILTLLHLTVAPFNEPFDFLIGDASPPYGAVLLKEDMSQLDLAASCGRADCPSVLVFDSQQWGTISVNNCKVGRKYLFVNKSRVDLGLVIQQSGGRFGSKAIGKYDVASCFCLAHELAIDETMDDHGSVSEPDGSSGILLCR